jgi:GNAT superfamily N-acetyltransferase
MAIERPYSRIDFSLECSLPSVASRVIRSHGILAFDMTSEIRPLRSNDLEELSQFLTEGFHAPRGADFAAPDVLRWKYLEPIGESETPRSFVACEGGRIIGHVGACPTVFHGGTLPPKGVSTLHMIDWLGAPERRSVGSSLMRHVHAMSETQYVLVANDRARRVTQRAGYVPVVDVPVFHKVLRAGYRWSWSGAGAMIKLLRVAKDAARKVRNVGEPPRIPITLQRVEQFGPEVVPILDDVQSHTIMTAREPARLNHALRFPRPGMSGWLMLHGGQLVGFALLNVARPGQVGKLVECLLEGDNIDLWHASTFALARELAGQGAGVAVGFGSTLWMAKALRRSGFNEAHRLEFTLRDRHGFIPRDTTFHLSPFEADYAYTS